MSIQSIDNLRLRAQQIKNELSLGANTHSRVGSLNEDMVDTLSQLAPLELIQAAIDAAAAAQAAELAASYSLADADAAAASAEAAESAAVTLANLAIKFNLMSYADIKQLRDNNELKAGSYYAINDFYSIADIPDYEGIDEAHALQKVSIDVQVSPDRETIILLAVSDSEFHKYAKSAEFPYDVLGFDFDFTTTEVTSHATNGRISFRRDENGNEANFDFRQLKVKRYSQGGDFIYFFDSTGTDDFQMLPAFHSSSVNAKVSDDGLTLFPFVMSNFCFVQKATNVFIQKAYNVTFAKSTVDVNIKSRIDFTTFHDDVYQVNGKCIITICIFLNKLTAVEINADLKNSKFPAITQCEINAIINAKDISAVSEFNSLQSTEVITDDAGTLKLKWIDSSDNNHTSAL